MPKKVCGPLVLETIGTLPGSLVHFLKTIGTLPVLSSCQLCHSFIICFLCEFYVFEVAIYGSPSVLATHNYGLNGGRTPVCMSTSTHDRSANIWPNTLKLYMHS